MHRKAFRHGLTALAAVATLAAAASAFAFSPPPYPRIGGIQVGGPFNYNDPTYQAELAKQDIMVLNDWPGLAPGGESMNGVIQAIKAINPNALVFLYVDSDEQFSSASGSAYASLRTQIDNMNWWLHSSKLSGSPVLSFFGDGGDTINNTPYTAKDAQGDDSIDYITKWFVTNEYQPNSDADGFFMDNVFTQPRVSGDWLLNGQDLSASSAQAGAALQAGYERYFSLVRQLIPGKYEIGNIATWAQHGPIPAGYQGMADGGEIEGLIGLSWSTEAWGGWQAMENQYYAVMSALNPPKLAIFSQWGNPTDYQSMRYGLASCLMNDGYYSFTSTSAGYSGVVWFDEYNAKLGTPTEPPPTGPWQKGVWRRDFTNGIALVNPKGNGPQTVQLGATFVHLKGSQDPSVNNGQQVTSVTLQDRDGLILLRKTPIQQPKAPTGVSISTG